jgi:hypothetical protein
MKNFTLKIENEEGVVHELPVPVATHCIMSLMRQDGEQKELLLTLENDIRLSIPVTDEDAEWIGNSN